MVTKKITDNVSQVKDLRLHNFYNIVQCHICTETIDNTSAHKQYVMWLDLDGAVFVVILFVVILFIVIFPYMLFCQHVYMNCCYLLCL